MTGDGVGAVKPVNYIEALDGLRGVAALIVVLGHASNMGWYLLPGLNFAGIAKTGVYLFFILSSYLLASQLLGAAGTVPSRSSLLRYFERRFMRIYPLYITFLTVGLITTLLSELLLSDIRKGLFITLGWNELFEQLFLLRGDGITWSIVVEFKFYFILPLLVYIIKLTDRIHPIAVCTLLVLFIGLAATIFPSSTVSIINRHQLTPYLSIFFIGVLLAYIQSRSHLGLFLEALPSNMLSWLAGFVLIIHTLMIPAVFSSLFFHVESYTFQKLYIAHSILWSVLLLAVINGNGLLQRFLSSRPLKFVGNVSFSLYLLHGMGLAMAKFLPVPIEFKAWVALLIALFLANLSYRFIELPTMRIPLIRIITGADKARSS